MSSIATPHDATARSTALVVMLKAPPRSKRRLAIEIGDDATTAAAHLAACALEDAADWPGPVWLSPAEPEDLAWVRTTRLPGQHIVLQQGESLGARINYVNRHIAAGGIVRQLYIGTDCPELDPDYLRTAATALNSHDAVLGPALDGGVVLMGTRRAWPDLASLPWSTGSLGAALAACLSDAGWRCATLPTLRDIDSASALHTLAGPLAHDPRAARRALGRWLDRTGVAPERLA